MPFVLIKNNLKLMLRSKWILFIMVILPLVTIALLANAFQDMMETSLEISEFKVGYCISDNSKYKEMLPNLQSICKENGVVLQEYPEGDISELLKNNTVASFVDIKDDNSYKIYQSDDKKAEAAITESIFTGFFYQINEAATSMAYGAEQGMTELPEKQTAKVTSETLKVDPVPSSTDYYGIIYIVYFAWCGMVSLVAVVSSERKNALQKRMLVSHMPRLSHYAGKLIPCTLAVFLEVCAAWILSVILFDIHWGNIGVSAFIIFLTSLGASAFGIVLFQLFNNLAISIVVGFVISWIEGFFGGSFQAYMYMNLPKKLLHASPIYYINRTLVEYSTMGHSDYTGICITFLIGIIVVCGIVGILLMNRKMEEQ